MRWSDCVGMLLKLFGVKVMLVGHDVQALISYASTSLFNTFDRGMNRRR
jgi:hypothetical protein